MKGTILTVFSDKYVTDRACLCGNMADMARNTRWRRGVVAPKWFIKPLNKSVFPMGENGLSVDIISNDKNVIDNNIKYASFNYGGVQSGVMASNR